MVTSDLHIFLNKTLMAASWMLTIILLIRILFGPLNYWIVLLCLVSIEFSITLVGGAFNVSAFVQMSIIMNFKWTYGFNDKKIISVSVVLTFLHLSVVLLNYVMVTNIFHYKGSLQSRKKRLKF